MTNFNSSILAKLLVCLVAGCSFSMAVQAQRSTGKVSSTPAAVQAFYADASHCSDMAAVPETQTDEEARRFSADMAKAVEALRSASPGLSYDKALFAIKAGCDKQLQADAGVATQASGPKKK